MLYVEHLTDEELEVLPTPIRIELENAVYKATGMIEDLEWQGKVIGNGHHIRQQICTFAVRMLISRWKNNEREIKKEIS